MMMLWRVAEAAARQLLHVATQRTPSTLIEARFVAPGGKLESDLLVFSQGGPLRLALRKELLSYGSVLLVLKTLEAKHFAIGIRARAGRAASVHAISADMRRQVNRDLLSDKFDECFPQLLDQLGELTTLPWQNKVQLLEIISKQFSQRSARLHGIPKVLFWKIQSLSQETARWCISISATYWWIHIEISSLAGVGGRVWLLCFAFWGRWFGEWNNDGVSSSCARTWTTAIPSKIGIHDSWCPSSANESFL